MDLFDRSLVSIIINIRNLVYKVMYCCVQWDVVWNRKKFTKKSSRPHIIQSSKFIWSTVPHSFFSVLFLAQKVYFLRNIILQYFLYVLITRP